MSAFGRTPEEFSELMGGPRITAGLLRRYAEDEGTGQFAEPEDHLIDPLRLRKLPKDINEAVPDASGLLNSRDELGWPGMLPGEEVGAAARGVGRAVKNLST